MYYFGYGSNMNHGQMKKRCPEARYVKRVFLENYKFVYDGHSNKRKGAVGNIVKSGGQIVWGGLFEIGEKCRDELDRCENYPIDYDRKYFNVTDDNESEFKAIVYLREPRLLGEPSPEYKKTIERGAEDCSLPADYIKKYL